MVLRREADGVRWWLERQALQGAAMPVPSLVLAWTARGDAAAAAGQAESLVRDLEREPLMAQRGASRSTAAGYWRQGEPNVTGRWTQERYRRILHRAAEPDGCGFDLGWSVPDPARPASYDWVSGILLSASADAFADGHWEWTLRASAGLFRGEALDAAAETWARLLHAVAARPETLWGAVFHDNWGLNQRLPYERYFRVKIPAADTGRTARGYYWANLLTGQHLAALGGARAAGRRCAGLGLRFEPVPGRDAAVVRDGGPISALDDSRLAALRELLAPVLVTVPYRFYGGPPLRVLKDPGTAFRRIPPEISRPRFDDDPPPARDEQTYYTLVPDDS